MAAAILQSTRRPEQGTGRDDHHPFRLRRKRWCAPTPISRNSRVRVANRQEAWRHPASRPRRPLPFRGSLTLILPPRPRRVWNPGTSRTRLHGDRRSRSSRRRSRAQPPTSLLRDQRASWPSSWSLTRTAADHGAIRGRMGAMGSRRWKARRSRGKGSLIDGTKLQCSPTSITIIIAASTRFTLEDIRKPKREKEKTGVLAKRRLPSSIPFTKGAMVIAGASAGLLHSRWSHWRLHLAGVTKRFRADALQARYD